MNQVDTSAETVEAEWRKIENEFGLVLGEEVETQTESQTVSGEHIPNDESEPEVKLSTEEFEQKKQVTKGLVNSGLKMAFFMLKVEEIPESITDDFCESWAEVIVNRFPDNPITDFMDAYGDLIAAGGATLVLFGAVRTQKSKAQVQQQIKSTMKKAQTEYEENGN